MDDGRLETSGVRRPRRRRRRMYVAGGAVAAIALIGAGLGIGVSGAAPAAQTANAATSITTTTRPSYCPVGMSAWKCQQEIKAAESSSTPPTTANPEALPVTRTRPTECGQTFFSATTKAQLTQHFGMGTGCFRPKDSDQWVLVRSDMTVGLGGTPPPPAPGGAIVALLDCAASDTACLNASATHTFATFTVYYMPYPEISRADLLLATQPPNTDLVIIADCGDYTFDTHNHQWYNLSSTQEDELKAGVTATLPTVPAPTSVSGAQGLANSAPAAVQGVNTTC